MIKVWREAVRTMLTEDTKNAFLCIELVDPTREEAFCQAITELKDLVENISAAVAKWWYWTVTIGKELL